MKFISGSKLVALFLILSTCLISTTVPVVAGESTMPMPPYTDDVSPELASKYTYIEDGELTKALDIPTYQWMPTSTEPLKAMFLAIHGLTLHGRRFRVLARAFSKSMAPDLQLST